MQFRLSGHREPPLDSYELALTQEHPRNRTHTLGKHEKAEDF